MVLDCVNFDYIYTIVCSHVVYMYALNHYTDKERSSVAFQILHVT